MRFAQNYVNASIIQMVYSHLQITFATKETYQKKKRKEKYRLHEYFVFLTFGSEVISLKACFTWSAEAPPPTSKKLAGDPP